MPQQSKAYYQVLILQLKKKQMVRYLDYSQSQLIGVFRPFILNVTTDILGLKSATVLFVFCMLPPFLFSYFSVFFLNIFYSILIYL